MIFSLALLPLIFLTVLGIFFSFYIYRKLHSFITIYSFSYESYVAEQFRIIND